MGVSRLKGVYHDDRGTHNKIDTVENVFIQNPTPSIWVMQVHAHEVNADGHVDTPQWDVDYALVVSGVSPP